MLLQTKRDENTRVSENKNERSGAGGLCFDSEGACDGGDGGDCVCVCVCVVVV